MTAHTGNGQTQPPQRELLPLPGLAAISLYLLVLAGVIILGVASGRHYPPLFLIFAALFMAASAGLFLLLRWAVLRALYRRFDDARLLYQWRKTVTYVTALLTFLVVGRI